MSTYEKRLDLLEKDASTMKRDIIYKLDDTNTALTMIKGIVGNQGQDVKDTRNQVRVINVRLDGIDTRLEGLKEEIRTIKDQQDTQGQDIKDIKRRLDAMDNKFDQMDSKLNQMDSKFDQMLLLLTTLTPKPEEQK